VRQRGLPGNVVASLLNAGAGIGVALITTPLIIDQVGTAGYGVWTIALAFILYLAIAEAGFGPAAQRFVAVAHGHGELGPAARIMWSTLALYVAVGLAALVVLLFAADDIVSLFDIPRGLEADARDLIRLVGVALTLGLAATAVGNIQAGLERFVALAVATIAGSIVYLVLIIVFVAAGASLFQLGLTVIAQQLVMLLVRLVSVRDVVFYGRPAIVSREEWSALWRFSAKLQASVLSLLINNQSDKVVVGLVAPASTVGQLGIATQIAEAMRALGAAALTPMISRLTSISGSGDQRLLHATFRRLNSLWLLGLIGAGAIVVASVYPVLSGWLGSGYGDAVLFAEFLVAAAVVGLFGGTRFAYLRATNQIGLEARLGLVVVALNVAFTIPLAVAIGAVGVVAGTLAANVLGLAWFVIRFNDLAPPTPPLPIALLVRAALTGAVMGAASLAWGIAVVALVPAGFALPPVLAGSAVALFAYGRTMTGTRPTPDAVYAWLEGVLTDE
jgi:O-antigen/teichoic acid export membrane protein